MQTISNDFKIENHSKFKMFYYKLETLVFSFEQASILYSNVMPSGPSRDESSIKVIFSLSFILFNLHCNLSIRNGKKIEKRFVCDYFWKMDYFLRFCIQFFPCRYMLTNTTGVMNGSIIIVFESRYPRVLYRVCNHREDFLIWYLQDQGSIFFAI